MSSETAPKAASEDGATGLLREARWYVNDALEAHEHSDGRDLLNRIDAALAASPTDATGAMQEAQFLLDRLEDHENRMTSDEDANEWHGHVAPAIARFRSALNLPVAGETL